MINVFHIFTGEIGGTDPPLKGFTPALLSFFLVYNLNGEIMAQRIEYKHGDVIGELTYLYELPRKLGRKAMFRCKCGKEFSTYIGAAKDGNTKSCGCRNRIPTFGNIRHGLNGSRLYKKWQGIKRRCYNKNEDMYHIYGGRGVIMYDSWLHDPKAFVDYCMTLEGWDDKSLTIDRIKSEGNYEPGNIRFVTYTVQARNIRLKSNNKSGYTGVIKVGNRFQSHICIDYNIINLGSFKTIIEAAKARDNYIIENNLIGFNLQTQ